VFLCEIRQSILQSISFEELLKPLWIICGVRMLVVGLDACSFSLRALLREISSPTGTALAFENTPDLGTPNWSVADKLKIFPGNRMPVS
jgi:hypothetical protein